MLGIITKIPEMVIAIPLDELNSDDYLFLLG